MNRGGHEDEVWSQQVLHKWQWNGSGFINTYKLGLTKFLMIRRVNVLPNTQNKTRVMQEMVYRYFYVLFIQLLLDTHIHHFLLPSSACVEDTLMPVFLHHNTLVLPPRTCQFPLNLVLWFQTNSSWSSLCSANLPMHDLLWQSTIIHPQDVSEPSQFSFLDISSSFCSAVFSWTSSPSPI